MGDTRQTGVRAMVIGLDAVSITLLESFPECCPNIRTHMAKGVSGRLMPCFPVYTPTNWAALCTGAPPSVSGLAGWHREAGGTDWHAFDSRAYACDTVFASCARDGIPTLAISYPGSFPLAGPSSMALSPIHRGLDKGAVAPVGRVAVRLGPDGSMPFDLLGSAKGAGVAVSDGMRGAKDGGAEAGGGLLPAVLTAAPDGDAGNGRGGAAGDAPRGYVLTVRDASGSVRGHPLKVGEWSPTIEASVESGGGPVTCGLRVRVREGGRTLEISELIAKEDIAAPGWLADEVWGRMGVPVEHPPSYYEILGHFHNETDLGDAPARAMDDLRGHADWVVGAVRTAMEAKGVGLLYMHYHLPDSMLHHCLAAAEGSAGYTPHQREVAVEALKVGVMAADCLVGGLLSLAATDAHTLLVSDHGCVPNRFGFNLANRLRDAGLCSLDGSGAVDRPASKAWPSDFVPSWVDVAAEEGTPEYERLQAEVIDAMLDWKAPSGERVVAVALRKKDSHLLGFGGPDCAAVTMHYNTGFAWSAEGAEALEEDLLGANHGCQMPASFAGLSDNLAFFSLAGPKVRAGLRWDDRGLGYVHITDMVPTLCELAGFKAPLDSTGCVRRAFMA